jgi:hypothetical protein
MKAQVSVELLLVIVLFLGVITPLFYFSFSQSADEIKISRTTHALDKITKSTDYVYSLDKGTKTQIQVELPEGITESKIQGKTLVYTIETKSGTTDIFSVSKADLEGELPTRSSTHMITIENMGDGVKIG